MDFCWDFMVCMIVLIVGPKGIILRTVHADAYWWSLGLPVTEKDQLEDALIKLLRHDGLSSPQEV